MTSRLGSQVSRNSDHRPCSAEQQSAGSPIRCRFSSSAFVHQPEVMLGVLEMSFSFNRITRCGRGPREHYVSLKALCGGRIGAAPCQT
jgi:hypothetical protein